MITALSIGTLFVPAVLPEDIEIKEVPFNLEVVEPSSDDSLFESIESVPPKELISEEALKSVLKDVISTHPKIIEWGIKITSIGDEIDWNSGGVFIGDWQISVKERERISLIYPMETGDAEVRFIEVSLILDSTVVEERIRRSGRRKVIERDYSNAYRFESVSVGSKFKVTEPLKVKTDLIFW